MKIVDFLIGEAVNLADAFDESAKSVDDYLVLAKGSELLVPEHRRFKLRYLALKESHLVKLLLLEKFSNLVAHLFLNLTFHICCRNFYFLVLLSHQSIFFVVVIRLQKFNLVLPF